MNNNKLYLTNWDYNAALILEELVTIVENNGGTVEPGNETIIENRSLEENKREASARLAQLEAIDAANAELKRMEDPEHVARLVNEIPWTVPRVDWSATINAAMTAAEAAPAAPAATQADSMTATEREALDRINARQHAANLFTNITPADIALEIEAMNEEKEDTTMSTTANELRKYVNSIAADLRKLYEADPTDEEREAAEESGEAYDLYTYFADALDIEYTISSRGDYLGARIAVALGGPSVYIDTRESYIEGYWGTDWEEAWIRPEICEEIDSIMEEYYDMVRGA